MIQTLLVELVKTMDVKPLVVASVKDVVDPETRRSHLRALLAAHMQVFGNVNLQSAMEFLRCISFRDETSKTTVSGEAAEAITEVVSEAYLPLQISQGDLASAEWVDVLGEIIRHDCVRTLVALDKAGLFDRAVTGAGSVAQTCWGMALSYKAERCNRYLLTTMSIADLGGFPAAIEPRWPESMAVARDVIAHVGAPQMETVLTEISRHSRYGSVNLGMRQVTMLAVAAVLERCSEDPALEGHPVFEDLLAATVEQTLTQGVNLDNADVAQVLLSIMERRHKLDSPAAFKCAEIMISADSAGDIMSPAYLASLLERGLCVESKPEWSEQGAVSHLLTRASLCHFSVLDRHVPDREDYMRRHGKEFAGRHSDCSSSGMAMEKRIKGVENVSFVALAEMGYPFGPIRMSSSGEVESKALYERIYRHYAGSFDAYLVGHLVGHLDETNIFEGADAISVAAGVGHSPSVEALAAKGRTLEARGRGGDTPLICALKRRDEDMVRLLIDLGADVTAKAISGATAMQLAKSEEIKQLIRAARTTRAVVGSLENESVPAAPAVTSTKVSRLGPI